MAGTDPQTSTATSTSTSTPTSSPSSTPTSTRSALGNAGMATVEHAIATLATSGFAGLLVAILTSGEVRGLLLGIVQRALTLG